MRAPAHIFILLTVAATAATAPLRAQDYRYEAGGGIGLSGYLGEASSSILSHPGYAATATFRYIISSRWALKANLATAHISGNTASQDNQLPLGQTHSFKSQLYDLGAQMEFNFLPFGTGSRYLHLKRLAPYITLGLGTTLAATGGKSHLALTLPMGIGVKYKLRERLNISAEFTMRKAFSDQLDGLADLQGIKSGWAKNTDWYSLTLITITYEFSQRCRTCHYVD